ncbi:MAG: sel1 repeat family protein [Akkermansiaceae bacterium]|nr:sel1 repeat family protein [Akkermansiaceae bacterium]
MNKAPLIITAVATLMVSGCDQKNDTGSQGDRQTKAKKSESRLPDRNSGRRPARTGAGTKSAWSQPEGGDQSAKTGQRPASGGDRKKPALQEIELPPLPEDIQSLSKMAEEGDPRAQLQLGNRFSSGAGVPQDLAEAAKWFRAAAEQGQPDAAYNLAMMYESGHGVNEDPEEAQKWYQMYNKNLQPDN